jgi:superfamily II DNA or RNA helicase
MKMSVPQQTHIESFLGSGDFQKVDDHLLPNNEGKRKVRDIVMTDIKKSKSITIVSGYASLDEILKVISNISTEQEMTILIGNEPSVGSLTTLHSSKLNLSTEMKKYWLEEKRISLTHTFTLLNAYRKIEQGLVQVRINSSPKKLHAKILLTDSHAMIGSSNFTVPGLGRQRELNSRFSDEELRRFESTKAFIDGCIQQSEDYKKELLELIDQLIRKTTWKEALACACWDLLEGNESDQVLRNLRLNESGLWPHQIQAISQGVGILREQGSLLVADATGSGKTKTGMWLMAAADSMVRMSQESGSLNPDPVMVVPKAVKKEWVRGSRRELKRVPEVIKHGQISISPPHGTEGAEILNRLNNCEVVMVDEAHNFYNKSQRTRRLRTHAAQSSILLTATPINRSFEDLLSLVDLLSQDDFDEELERKLRDLRKQVYSEDKRERTLARASAAKLVQEFTIRRTRFDLNRIAKRNPERYLQPGRNSAGFPERNQRQYDLEVSKNDSEKIELIKRISSELVGIAFLPKEIRLSQKQKDLGFKEESIIKQTISLAKAGAQYRIWSTLASSKVAAFEHVTGTEKAMEVFGIQDFKNTKSEIPDKIGQIRMPKWSLSEDLKDSELVPSWLVNEEEFASKVKIELARYERISYLLSLMDDEMETSRVKLLMDHFSKGDKVLAFDWHLISLEKIRNRLLDEGIPASRIHLFSAGNKEHAEKYFSLESDEKGAIGLCSDSLSEGINLQGANVMVNLERPTTVRRFEQRMGRVDRMNSRHDEIDIYVPTLPVEIADELKDHLSERLELVREVFGGNDIDVSQENEFGTTSLDEVYDGNEAESEVVIEDAYSPVRSLIGDDGLLSEEEYEDFGTPNVRARAEICVVGSQQKWCFFAINTRWNSSIKWALLTYKGNKANVNTNLSEICEFLSSQLSGELSNPNSEELSNQYVQTYFSDLEINRESLLPKRFRNALLIGTQYFAELKSNSFRPGSVDFERLKVIQRHFGEAFAERKENQLAAALVSVDKTALAEGWLKLTNPYKREALRKTDRRSNSDTRKRKFLNYLASHGPNLDDFENLVLSCPPETELDSEVMIAIAGIPLS